MRCEVETKIGVQYRMEYVVSLEKISDAGGFWINGLKKLDRTFDEIKQEPREFPLECIGLNIGSRILFVDGNGKEYRYEIRTAADTLRIINEVNFLLDLEEV